MKIKIQRENRFLRWPKRKKKKKKGLGLPPSRERDSELFSPGEEVSPSREREREKSVPKGRISSLLQGEEKEKEQNLILAQKKEKGEKGGKRGGGHSFPQEKEKEERGFFPCLSQGEKKRGGRNVTQEETRPLNVYVKEGEEKGKKELFHSAVEEGGEGGEARG